MRRILTALRKKLASVLPRRVALAPVPAPRRLSRGGVTLVEMLVTVAITLVMMAAVVNIFASVGKGVQDRRASIEMSNQLRIARMLLAQDLARMTSQAFPPRDPSAGEGYIEIIEGIHTDWYPTRLTDGQTDATVGNYEIAELSTWLAPRAKAASEDEDGPTFDSNAEYRRIGLSGLGDFDDVLALTVQSPGEPFVGRFGNQTIKSHEAEIIWYAVENPPVSRSDPLYLGEPGMRTIYRRVLLIAPWLEEQLQAQVGLADARSEEGLREFYRNHDLSVRIDPETGLWVPNSLSDLTKRENRFAHAPGFPHGIDLDMIRFLNDSNRPASATPLAPLGMTSKGFLTGSDSRVGEDIVLTNVLAFDLRVYDPLAPLLLVNGTVVEPSDIGWHRRNPADAPIVIGRGAYVDLAYVGDPTQGGYERYDVPSGQATSVFSMAPHPRSGFVFGGGQLVRSFYDSWSTHYEYDGINQDRGDLFPDGDALVDEGSNGIDDDGLNGVDDMGERETSPPYLNPLRGFEVKLRIYETDSRAVKEVSIKQSLVR